MDKNWTTSDLVKLFRLNTSTKTPIIYAEKKRGNTTIFLWEKEEAYQ